MKPHYFDTNRVDQDDTRHFEAVRLNQVGEGCLLGGVLIDGLAGLAPKAHGEPDICAVCPASAEWRRICMGRPQKVQMVVDANPEVVDSRNNTADAYRIRQDQQIAEIYAALGLQKAQKKP